MERVVLISLRHHVFLAELCDRDETGAVVNRIGDVIHQSLDFNEVLHDATIVAASEDVCVVFDKPSVKSLAVAMASGSRLVPS